MMRQQREEMDAKISTLWRAAGEPCTKDEYIKQFYIFQTQHDLSFQACLEKFRFKRKRYESSSSSSSDESSLDYPLSENTVKLLTLTIHNCVAEISDTNLRKLWKIVLDSDDDNEDSDDDQQSDDDDQPNFRTKKFSDQILTYDQLEVIRSLLVANRRGTLKLTKLTLANIFLNIENIQD